MDATDEQEWLATFIALRDKVLASEEATKKKYYSNPGSQVAVRNPPSVLPRSHGT